MFILLAKDDANDLDQLDKESLRGNATKQGSNPVEKPSTCIRRSLHLRG